MNVIVEENFDATIRVAIRVDCFSRVESQSKTNLNKKYMNSNITQP